MRNKWFLCVLCVQLGWCTASIITAQTTDKRVCIIGAGIAGLTSAKYMKEEGINFTVLEATNYVGGTWRYEPKIGTDEYGMPIYTSMYKHLRTNLPKPTMELRGFPAPDSWPSFPSWKLFYEYLKDYSRHLDLEKHIKFLHIVTSVRREGNIWKVTHKHIPSGEEFVEDYDFVVVGTGHHSKPNMPNIPGEKLFNGTIIHSHDYRVPDVYKDRRVLMIGSGPSGMDISLDVAETAKTLIHSHHSVVNFRTPFPANYIKKPDVKEFNETGAIFVDGTYEDLDDVIYCTGFEYDYHFLDETSGLTLSKRTLTPLHNYVVNIHQPTMVFMGLVVRACIVIAIDAQVMREVVIKVVTDFMHKLHAFDRVADFRERSIVSKYSLMAQYVTALLKGNFTLPTKEKMLEIWQKRVDAIRSRGKPISHIHILDHYEDQYYAELTRESGIPRVPPVMFKIRSKDMEAKLENLYTYRNYVYTIIDDETFTRTLEKDKYNKSFGNELH